MRSGAIPFQFDITHVLKGLARCADARPGAVHLSVPFIRLLAHPSALEKTLGKEIVVRAVDRRVLSAQECCDSCIDSALQSLQELRAQLVQRRVELMGEQKSVLFQLIDLMLVAIRQFLTFEQKLHNKHRENSLDLGDSFRLPEDRQIYFDALELLRGHLSRSLGQIGVVAGMGMPSDGLVVGYQGDWPTDAYKPVDAAEIFSRRTAPPNNTAPPLPPHQ